jgi:FkbM family methyltransferase
MRNGALRIRLSNQVTLAAPGRLDSITAYVLLEQETWFEKELSFLERWLKSGMTAIDIGANLGVYALLMARLVGPHGRVLAYEPGSEARDLLQQSREINAASNLEIFNFALSDCEREGRLLLNASSELNALGDTGFGEQVRITSLDAEIPGRDLPPPDFVKIDAEGEEERILAGGRDFFARYSPLVVFEIKAGPVINENLPAAFRAIGYELFRLLVGAPILVPLDPRVPLDPFELNLFACKPDRIGSL